MTTIAIFFDLPVSYKDGLAIQEKILEARIKNLVPDTVLFLEHLPVITCGVKSKLNHILLSAAELQAKNIELANSSRGGAVTYHGPGQLVIYPIIRLGDNRADARGYLYNLEEVAIRTAKDFGVSAYRRTGMTGAWTEHGKLAAIGVRFRRWVTFHGMSFNVNPDLTGFETIIPCGLEGEKIASLQKILGHRCPNMENVRRSMTVNFGQVFGRNIKIARQTVMTPGLLPTILTGLAYN